MKSILAYDDLLTRSDTVTTVVQGSLGWHGADARAWHSDDLTEMTALQVGGSAPVSPIVRFTLATPRAVAILAVLNIQFDGQLITDTFTWPVNIRLRDATGTQVATSGTLTPQVRALTARARDLTWIPASPVTCSIIDFEFSSALASMRAWIGRLFAATGLLLDDNTDAGWSVSVSEAQEAKRGVAGGARPANATRQREFRVALGGLTEAQAYGTAAFGSAPVPGLVDVQENAGASRPVLFALRSNGTATDVSELTVFGTLADPLALAREAAEGSLYSASFTLREAPR